MPTTRVLYLEPDPCLRRYMTQFMEDCDGLDVVAAVGSAAEALEVDLSHIDAAVVEVALSPWDLSGYDIALALRRRKPIGIVFFTQHPVPDITAGSQGPHQGGWSLLHKTSELDPVDFTHVVQSTARGLNFVDPASQRLQRRQAASLLSRLTERQREMLTLASGGMDGKAIAQQSRDARNQLVAEAVGNESTQAQQDELTRRMSEELMTEVNSELVPAREAIDSMLRRLNEVSTDPLKGGADDWEAAAQLLRGTAAESVRPLSGRMWRRGEELRARERWWMIPANIVRHQPFRPLAFAVVDVLGTLAQQAHIFGLTDALVLLVAGLILTIALMLAGNALMRRHPDKHALIFLGTLLALQLTVVLRTWLRESFVAGSAPLSWQVTQVLATVLVVLVTSAFGAWRDKEAETLLTLRNTLRHEQVVTLARNQRVASLARELAQMLHGSVQSRLIACAMLLENDDRQNDNATLNAALARALDVLNDPLQPRERAGSMLDEVNRKVALWDGFCDFNVHITDAAAASIAGAVIGRVVEEGITNALRHGRATRIDIEIDSGADGNVSIVMIDNGVGPQNGAPGLGAAYLDQATSAQWSLTPLAHGACLEAHIRP